MEQLRMLRPKHSPALTRAEFPQGFSLRSYNGTQADGRSWCACCIDGELGVDRIDYELFRQRMLEDKKVRPEGILFVCGADDTPVGTATAVRNGSVFMDTGTLHMVAIMPQYRGRGLAAPLNGAVIELLQKWGNPACDLSTDDFRLNAIRNYLRLGFLPLLYKPDMRARWEKVLRAIEKTSSAALTVLGEPAEDLRV